MSQIALLLMGGEAQGERLRAYSPGTPVSSRGIGAMAWLLSTNKLTAISAPPSMIWIAGSTGRDRLRHVSEPCYKSKAYDVRSPAHAGAIAVQIHHQMYSGRLQTGKMKTKVQDAYSMRSSPQVIGAAHDALAYARQQVEIELNGVGDNPIFLPDYRLTLTGANFQGSPVSLPMDMAGAAITMVCVLSERRLNRLTNPKLSVGLPDFLTKGAGMFSGMMLSQYTADTLIVEQRILSAPASIQSIPAAADQEDFVSMGMNTALKNVQILENAYGILGIESWQPPWISANSLQEAVRAATVDCKYLISKRTARCTSTQ
jgi:histidine ammonia-lyase